MILTSNLFLRTRVFFYMNSEVKKQIVNKNLMWQVLEELALLKTYPATKKFCGLEKPAIYAHSFWIGLTLFIVSSMLLQIRTCLYFIVVKSLGVSKRRDSPYV